MLIMDVGPALGKNFFISLAMDISDWNKLDNIWIKKQLHSVEND